MSGNGKAPPAPTDDLIGQAINAAAAAGPVMINAAGTFVSSGRPFKVILPQDITDQELVDLTSFLTVDMRANAAQARRVGRGKMILVPR